MGSRITFSIIALALSLNANAKDNGHCLKLYEGEGARLFQQEQSKREDARAYTGVFTVMGGATVVGLATGNPIVAGISGTISVVSYFGARHSQAEAERMANEYEGKVLESRMVFKAYADVVAHGRVESDEGVRFARELKADPAREAELLNRLVEEMESGALCNGESIKSLGEVFAELKNGDVVVEQALF